MSPPMPPHNPKHMYQTDFKLLSDALKRPASLRVYLPDVAYVIFCYFVVRMILSIDPSTQRQSSRDMKPLFTAYDANYLSITDTKFESQFFARSCLSRIKRSDFLYLKLRQFAVSILRTLAIFKESRFGSVLHIDLVWCKEKMNRIDAPDVIAMMARLHAIWNDSIVNNPRSPVGWNLFSRQVEPSVTSTTPCPNPNPTRASFWASFWNGTILKYFPPKPIKFTARAFSSLGFKFWTQSNRTAIIFHRFILSRMGYWPCGTFSLCANLQRKAILCL